MGLSALATATACARQEFPPGGPEDRRPPVVVRTVPPALGTLTDADGWVVFHFDERISERISSGTLESAFTISPRPGQIRASKDARILRVRPRDGFQPGLVYRVTLNAVVSDLFGNRMTDPFELVFTTGDVEAVATTLAGEVWDRITGRPVAQAVVVALDDDGVVHQASSDVNGIFAFRYLPGGTFRVTAFEDRDFDGEADSTEVQGSTTVRVEVSDTVLVDLPVLEPDTSAAMVADADVLDSATVVVTFDDPLDPEQDVASIEVTLSAEGVAVPGVARVLREAEYARLVRAVADSLQRLDSIDAAARAAARAAAPDSPGVDTAAAADTGAAVVADTSAAVVVAPEVRADAPADTVRVGAPRRATEPEPRVGLTDLQPLSGERPGLTQDGRRVLPGRRIVLRLDAALAVEVPYEVRVAGVRNIAGLEGGGGTAEFMRERPPPADTASTDTTQVDTTQVDTTQVDTTRIDTTQIGATAVPGG